MPAADRRSFLGSSLGGLAAALAAGPRLLGQTPAYTASTEGAMFAPETLFLTWQRDPTTTMTVQWVGSEWEATDRTVTFAPLTSAAPVAPAMVDAWAAVQPTAKPFPLTDLKVFRAELTGLRPGTEYRFRIGRESPTYRFRTMPAKNTTGVQFVSGGDCGVNPHVVANNILAAKQDPHFCLIGGDLAYDNGKSPAVVLGFLRNYSRHMVDSKGRLIPMVACVGNHEVAGGYDKKRKDAPLFLALFDGLFNETTYATLDFGDYLSLVLMDSGHVAPIAGDQTDWLDGALKARAGRPHLIVANHVPAYPSFRQASPTANEKSGTGAENREHWVPLFEKHGVPAVLEHHDHTFKRTHPLIDGRVDRDGVVYLGDGSWGRIRAPKAPEARPYLAAVGQAYHFTLHRLEDEQRFHVALEETGKVADVCATGQRLRKSVAVPAAVPPAAAPAPVVVPGFYPGFVPVPCCR